MTQKVKLHISLVHSLKSTFSLGRLKKSEVSVYGEPSVSCTRLGRKTYEYVWTKTNDGIMYLLALVLHYECIMLTQSCRETWSKAAL